MFIINTVLEHIVSLIHLLVFGCARSSLLHTGFLCLQGAGAAPGCVHWLLTAVVSRCRARALQVQAGAWLRSSCSSRALVHRLNTCFERAQLLRGVWDSPRPGSKPVSPAPAGRFLPPGSPGELPVDCFCCGKNYGSIVLLEMFYTIWKLNGFITKKGKKANILMSPLRSFCGLSEVNRLHGYLLHYDILIRIWKAKIQYFY